MIFNRLWRSLRYRHFDADLREEIEFHRQMKAQAGDEMREMGNVTLAREEARAVWVAPWIDGLRQDLVYAARSLRRQPAFTIAALAALVLAIGLNTSLFTVFNALALRPWNVADPWRMVVIFDQRSNGALSGGFSLAEYRYWRDHATTLSGLLARRDDTIIIGEGDAAQRMNADFVSGNYFDVLGVPTILGRAFVADEDRLDAPQAVCVIGYGLWQRRYGGDPAVIGRTVRLNDATFTIVGVVTSDFAGTGANRESLWVPLAAMPLVYAGNDGGVDRNFATALLKQPSNCCSSVAGRLAPGVTRAQAQRELDQLSATFRRENNEQPSHPVVAATRLLAQTKGNQAMLMFALLAIGTTLVLLLACANVGNLFIARALARQREIAVRLSLGASRARVIRQLLTESLLLAAIAGAIGMAVAFVLPNFLVQSAFASDNAPQIAPDWLLVVFTCGLCAIACLLFGLAPAIKGTRDGVAPLFTSATGSTQAVGGGWSLRSVLLATQLAISLILLVTASLLARGVQSAASQDPGFTIDGISVATLELPARGFDRARGTAFVSNLAVALRARPDLGSVAFTALEPLARGRILTSLGLPGEGENKARTVQVHRISPEYFDVLGIPFLAGRGFADTDAKQPVAILNQTLARQLFGNENPIGRTILLPTATEVIGVVRDAATSGLDRHDGMFYRPLEDTFPPRLLIKARNSAEVGAALQAVVHNVDPLVSIKMESLRVNFDRWLTASRVGAQIAGAVALLALILAAVGVFGVFAFVVQARTPEIGLRMAIGARPSQVIAFVLRSTAWTTLGGIGAGLIGAFAAARLLQGALFGVSPFDPLAYAVAASLLAVAAGIATYIPARRATRIDPITALRCD
jgi:predicted permease